MTDAQIRLLGGGASQFSLSAGTPLTSVSQFDAGLYLERRLAGASQPDLQLRPALRNAEQHQRPRGFFAARGAGVGHRRQGEYAGQDGAARRLRHLLRPRERKRDAERTAVQRRDAAIVLHHRPLVLSGDSHAGRAGGRQAAAEPAVCGQRPQGVAHLPGEHRSGPADHQVGEDQRGVPQRARHAPFALARHQRADRRAVPVRRFADTLPDGVHRLQPHQPDSGDARASITRSCSSSGSMRSLTGGPTRKGRRPILTTCGRNGGRRASATCGIAWWWAPACRCRGRSR